MPKMEIEWDDDKAERNIARHGVTFEEAASCFYDELAYIFEDERHSCDEARDTVIGYSSRNRLLLVVFTERGEALRIISARRAEPKERKLYEQAKRF